LQVILREENMSDLRNNKQIQNAQWTDYVGGILRGSQSINQLVPQHPYLKDVPGLEDFQSEKTTDIIILTIPEAMLLFYGKTEGMAAAACSQASTYYHSHSGRQITVDILNAYDASSKKGIDIFMLNDSMEYLRNSRSLMTYYDQAGELAWKLSSFWKVKAKHYTVNGKIYIKITGYAGLRRILKGTRYVFNNPQLMEFGIGRKGVLGKVFKGMKYNIWFSGAFHLLQFLFDSKYDFVDFFVDIPMDIAKLIVTNLVVSVVAGAMTFIGVSVIFAGFIIIAAAIAAVIILEWLDDEVFHTSKTIKSIIREGLALHSQQLMHGVKALSPWQYMLTHPYGY